MTGQQQWPKATAGTPEPATGAGQARRPHRRYDDAYDTYEMPPAPRLVEPGPLPDPVFRVDYRHEAPTRRVAR